MDHLLEKLRQNMAELSVQGDDFTRQIWQMYAAFEDLRKASVPRDGRRRKQQQRRPPRQQTPRERRVIGGSALDLAMAATTAIEFDVGAGSSKDDMSLLQRRPQHHRCRLRRSRRRADNPLLDTISSIQDPCESDDYAEQGAGAAGARGGGGAGARLGAAEPDKDSIGYAGSNSVDSGYKSSCPTPEPDYGNDAASKRSSVAGPKPRIAMGTKVINRHSHPQYAGRDLDHLMYLRQSILSAMQRYEQQETTALGGGAAAAVAGGSPRRLPQRRATLASCPGSRTHSPCPSTGSDHGSPAPAPSAAGCRLATAEEDIDTLLYGQPCSYVTMIEDKYRRSSVARVKKLREKSRSALPVTESSSSDSSCGSPTQSGRFSEVAKCMLEIIEDLQNQTQSPPEPAPPEHDYHVYEEIMYELTTRPRADTSPPPLPARPDNLAAHRPKQRSNLYSLFREPSARRDISQSLEQEFRNHDAEEEYGFRVQGPAPAPR